MANDRDDENSRVWRSWMSDYDDDYEYDYTPVDAVEAIVVPTVPVVDEDQEYNPADYYEQDDDDEDDDMENFKRVTAEEVIAAYEATGAVPSRNVWRENRKLAESGGVQVCVCGIGVIWEFERKKAHDEAIEAWYRSGMWGPLPETPDDLKQVRREENGDIHAYMQKTRKFPPAYTTGFADGFDGFLKSECRGKNSVYLMGYEDGERVAIAVFSHFEFKPVEEEVPEFQFVHQFLPPGEKK